MATTSATINVGAITIGRIEVEAGFATSKAIHDIDEEGAAQVANVETAGEEQVDAIEEAGAEVLASIPEDYTELSNAFTALGLHADEDGTLYQD